MQTATVFVNNLTKHYEKRTNKTAFDYRLFGTKYTFMRREGSKLRTNHMNFFLAGNSE